MRTLLHRVAGSLLVGAIAAAAPLAEAAPGGMDADGQGQSVGTQQTKTTSELLSDLGSDNGPNRLYAARALKAQLSRALRTVEHAKAGSLAGDEALSTLDELEVRLPEQCRAALGYRNVVASAAEMLALLGAQDSLPAITEAASKETRKGVKKRLDAAMKKLQALFPPAPEPAPPEPAATDPAPSAAAWLDSSMNHSFAAR